MAVALINSYARKHLKQLPGLTLSMTVRFMKVSHTAGPQFKVWELLLDSAELPRDKVIKTRGSGL